MLNPFYRVGGYNPNILRGEEPELGFRLHRHGYHILLIEQVMCIHQEEYNIINTVWKRPLNNGRSNGLFLRFPIPSIYTADLQYRARRIFFRGVAVIIMLIGLLLLGAWWILPLFPLLLALYTIIRFWQPSQLRWLRIGYYMMGYFVRPIFLLGMIQSLLSKRTKR